MPRAEAVDNREVWCLSQRGPNSDSPMQTNRLTHNVGPPAERRTLWVSLFVYMGEAGQV